MRSMSVLQARRSTAQRSHGGLQASLVPHLLIKHALDAVSCTMQHKAGKGSTSMQAQQH
jgi:hypothetical protein